MCSTPLSLKPFLKLCRVRAMNTNSSATITNPSIPENITEKIYRKDIGTNLYTSSSLTKYVRQP